MPRTIETSRFGPYTVYEEDIVYFPEGVPAFETHNEWAIVGGDAEPIKWLQSLSDGDVALPVARPSVLLDTYAPRFADEDLEDIRCGSDEGLLLLLVLSIPEGRPWEMTANLRAPIVLQSIRKVAKQIICLNEDYPLNAHVLPGNARRSLEQRHGGSLETLPPSGEE